VGEGLVVAVQQTSATIRIDSARDVIEVGDSAALHRPIPGSGVVRQ
jgi:hypothetical protein